MQLTIYCAILCTVQRSVYHYLMRRHWLEDRMEARMEEARREEAKGMVRAELARIAMPSTGASDVPSGHTSPHFEVEVSSLLQIGSRSSR